jgi:hypothetical protein
MNNRKIAAILIAAFAWSVPNAYAQENNPENKHADSASQWKGTRVHVLKANTIVPQKPIARVGILAVDSLVIKNPICVVFSPTIIPPVKMADEGPKADKQNSTANEPFFTKWKDVIAALGMFGALGVSLGALCISIRALHYTGNLFRVTRNGAASQIRESKNLIGITSDTANRQLRAYVGITDVRSYADKVTFGISNYGQTPAQDVLVWANCGETALSTEDLKTFRENDMSAGTLWPGNLTRRGVDRNGLESPFTFRGVLTYTDIFKKSHTTTFQYFVMDIPGIHKSGPHDKGNSFT